MTRRVFACVLCLLAGAGRGRADGDFFEKRIRPLLVEHCYSCHTAEAQELKGDLRLGRTYLGLSINCARCHDHKFDPLTNEDYYALYGFFQSTRHPWPGIELDKAQRDLVPLAPLAPPAQAAEILNARRRELAGLDARLKNLRADLTALKPAISFVGPPQEEREVQKHSVSTRVHRRQCSRLGNL